MSLIFRIANRLLYSKHHFGFISFSSILSIIALSVGISALIIVSCITDGFNNEIIKKLSNIDGHIRINSFYNNSYQTNSLDSIQHKIKSLPNIISVSRYIENHAMIKKNTSTEGIIIYGFPNQNLDSIFNLDQLIISGSSKLDDDNSIIIGSELSQELGLKIGDVVQILNLENIIKNHPIDIMELTISGIYKSGFDEYDRLLAFMQLEQAQLFFNNIKTTGLIVSVKDPNYIEIYDDIILNNLDISEYYTTTWKERHDSIISWLKVYDIPINVVILFITILAIFNISSSIWLIIIEKVRSIGVLRAIGFKKSFIRNIFITYGLIISLYSSIIGILLSFILLYCQQTFHWISLDSNVYFMEYLPVSIKINYFIIFPFSAILITILVSLIPSIKASKFLPAIAVKYE